MIQVLSAIFKKVFGFKNLFFYFIDQSCKPTTSRSVKSDSCSSFDIQKQLEYNVGVNLFNIKPEKGINYFLTKGFVHKSANDIARFLMINQELSRQKVGEYLSNLRSKFVKSLVKQYLKLINLSRLQIDEALRKCLSYFWILGEAQRIEFLIEEFSKRYLECNPDVARLFKNKDSVSCTKFLQSGKINIIKFFLGIFDSICNNLAQYRFAYNKSKKSKENDQRKFH